MTRQIEVPLSSDVAEGDVSGDETLINLYPRVSDGGKYQFTLTNSPGLAFFAELPTFPVIGLYNTVGKRFAVTPTRFYELFSDGRSREIGEVALGSRIDIADNGLQIVIVDGVSGYSYDIDADEITKIEAEFFHPASSVTEQDGYFIFNKAGTNFFFITSLLSVDFPGDTQEAGGKTDPLVKVLSDHREVFLFGTKTTRVQYNSGDADFPFELNQGAYIEKGCAAPHTVVKQNNTVYFIGSDLMIYELTGYTPRRISTHAVESSIASVDLSDAFAYAHQENGHLFYTVTIPAKKLTWRFDISTRKWHICKDYHFGRHRSNCADFFDGKTLVGDFQSGRIYQMVSNYYTDDGAPIEREVILPTINFGRDFTALNSFELDMSSGVGLTTGQGDDPIAELTFSKDGKTFSNIKQAKIGKKGKYLTRVKWNRLGSARQFMIKIRITDPIPIDIGGAWIEPA